MLPRAPRLTKQQGKLLGRPASTRRCIRTKNDAPVSTALFIDPQYAGISPIMACSMDRSTNASLPVDIVHNHNAHVPVPERILGRDGVEFVTKAIADDEFDIIRQNETGNITC
jgi:hypothetical protein